MDNNAFASPEPEIAPPPGGLPFGTLAATTPMVAAADHAARHWAGNESGPVKLGTDAHKRLACRMFRETFNPYKPSVIDWPKLRDRLVNLPIWDIAVQTEGKARLNMLTYAHSLSDADWHDAIELNGWEEGRHKAVLSNLVQAYRISLVPEPEYVESRSPVFAYIRTGFSECIDSFFAFLGPILC